MAEWVQIQDRKWELRQDFHVLATIYHQSRDGRYSLYIAIPIQSLYATKINIIGQTHNFKELQGAKDGAVKLMKEKLVPWFDSMKSYLNALKA